MTELTTEELRARAILGLDSYKLGYKHGIQESELDIALAKLTIEQLKARLVNADLHIERLEATILRVGYPKVDEAITDPDADGYRPPCCDHAAGTNCCSGLLGCAADRELKEMGKL